MLRRTFALTSIVFVLSLLALTAGAAPAPRTFVASYGLTANTAANCSIAKPCRAFSEALGVTSLNGEVIVLDSAGYGTATIAQSVSIIAPSGVYAGISVYPGFDGITVVAGPTDRVTLRGLTINGQGGDNGIVFSQGAELNVEDCEVSGMAADGIAASAVSGQVIIKNTVSRDNAGNGFSIAAASGSLRATLDRVYLTNNLNGLYATGSVTATITDSVVSGNTTGLRGNGPAIGITTIVGSHNKIIQNSTGALANAIMGLVYVLLDGNIFSRNSTAVSIGSGSIGITYGNNIYANNSSDGSTLGLQLPK